MSKPASFFGFGTATTRKNASGFGTVTDQNRSEEPATVSATGISTFGADHYFNLISDSAHFEGETVIKEVPVAALSRFRVIRSARGRCETYELSPKSQRVIACCDILSYGGGRLSTCSLIIAGASAIISVFVPPAAIIILPALYSSGSWGCIAVLSEGLKSRLHTISFVECECTTGATADPETSNIRFTVRLAQKDYDKVQAQLGTRSVAEGNSGFGTALAHA